MKFSPKCDMLIDQNIYIGNDPIGHVCYNDADLQNEEYFICNECINHLQNGTGNITVPLGGSVKYFQNIKNSFSK